MGFTTLIESLFYAQSESFLVLYPKTKSQPYRVGLCEQTHLCKCCQIRYTILSTFFNEYLEPEMNNFETQFTTTGTRSSWKEQSYCV